MTQKTWLKKRLAAEMLAAMMVSSGWALAEPLHGQLKFCFQKEDMLDAAQDDVIWDKRVQQHRCFSMEVNCDVTHTEVLPVGEEMRYFGEVTILLTNQLAYPAYTVFRDDQLKNRGPRA
jgi:hypothetical protein